MKGQWLEGCLTPLRSGRPGYHIVSWLLNTRDHGVAQFRNRAYIVGVRKDLASAPLPPLLGLASELTPSLADILVPRQASDDSTRLPPASWTTAVHNVIASSVRATKLGIQGDWIINQAKGVTASGSLGPLPRQEFPALLHASRGGFWIGSRGRKASLREA